MSTLPLRCEDGDNLGFMTAPSINVSGGRCLYVSASYEMAYAAADGQRIDGFAGTTNASGLSNPILIQRKGVFNLQDSGQGISAGDLVIAKVGGFIGVVATETATVQAIGRALADIDASGYGPVLSYL